MNNNFIIILLVALLLSTSCSNNNSTTTLEATVHHNDEIVLSLMQFKNSELVLTTPSTQNIKQTIKVNGLLDVPPQNLISISAPYGGFLKSTKLLQGMHVNKSEVIAQMEHPDYIQLQQDYLENISQLAYLKADFERQETLAKTAINSQQVFQKAKSEYEVIKARVSGIRAKLELIHVNINTLEKGEIQKLISLTSPINGYVTKVNTNIGAFVTANTVLFEIVDTEHLHAEISVFEKDINKIAVNQNITFMLANETKERHAKVHLIGREITADRTVRVHCHLNEEDKNLLPGMFLTAFIEIKNSKANVLPNDAFVDNDGSTSVFVLENKTDNSYTFKRIIVTKTGEDGGMTAFTSTQPILTKQVVTKGAYKLLSAMINATEEEGAHAH